MEMSIYSGLFSLVGVIIGASLTLFKDWLLQKKTRIIKAHYLAVRVVCTLDQFVMECLEVAYDDGLGNEPDVYQDRREQVIAPNSVHFPDDIEWENIDVKLTYKALSIPARLAAAKDRVSDVAEWDGAPYHVTMQERQYQFAVLGLFVVAVAAEFRELCNIPDPDYLDFRPAERLKEIKQQIEEAREKHRSQT